MQSRLKANLGKHEWNEDTDVRIHHPRASRTSLAKEAQAVSSAVQAFLDRGDSFLDVDAAEKEDQEE